MPKALTLNEDLHAYLVAHSTPADVIARELIEETRAELGRAAGMQVAPEQAAFLEIFTRIIGARQVVEIGTFTGLSTLSMARGLAPDGQILACDVSDEYTSVARRYWARAGVSDRITLRIGPGIETLRSLPSSEQFDLAFIDADKGGYIGYWEELVPRLRPGGVLLVDNTLWSGRVVDDTENDEDTVAIRAFNDHAAADKRVELVVLPIADGLTLARKR